jgi:hypothetical protein
MSADQPHMRSGEWYSQLVLHAPPLTSTRVAAFSRAMRAQLSLSGDGSGGHSLPVRLSQLDLAMCDSAAFVYLEVLCRDALKLPVLRTGISGRCSLQSDHLYLLSDLVQGTLY